MQVWSLGWEDLLEEELAPHSRFLAWRIPWTEEPGGLQYIGSQRIGHNWSDFAHFSFDLLFRKGRIYIFKKSIMIASYFEFNFVEKRWKAILLYVCVSRSVISDSANTWTVAHQAPLVLEFSRQENWSGLPFPSLGDLPNPLSEPGPPALQADTLPSKLLGKPYYYICHSLNVVVVQSQSHVQLFATPWTSGFSVLHYLLEFAQTHVHWVGDANQPSHPLFPPSPPKLNHSQHQTLFQLF